MTDQLTRLHETWLGMVQPVEGLVVSVPVLVDAQVGRPDETPAALQETLLSLCPENRIADVSALLSGLLALTPDLFDGEAALPEELALFVPAWVGRLGGLGFGIGRW